MNAINHEQAQLWLNARLAGALSSTEAQALDAHLQDCPDCRRYALQIEKLDAGLRRYFRERAVNRPTARTADSVADQVRANMFAKRILSFAGSAALLLGMIALVVVLASLSAHTVTPAQPAVTMPPTQLAVTMTPTRAETAPAPTSTPLPTAVPAPLETVDQIAAELNRLAWLNAQFLHQAGWLRVQSSDPSPKRPEMMFYSETWRHYPQADGVCTEGFIASGPRPGVIDWEQVWSDGWFGSRLEMRSKGRVEPVTPADVRCVAEPAKMDAGELAARLQAQRAYMGSDLQWVQAWYETLDDRPMLVVKAQLLNNQATPPMQTEQFTFSVETGLLRQHSTLMQLGEGSSATESGIRYQADFIAELPAETAPIFARAAAELKETASGQGSLTASPTPAADILDTFPTSPDTAAGSDVAAIGAALRALRQRQLQWLSTPGWYVYEDPAPVTGEGLNNLRRLLIHSLGDGRCELMAFYRTGSQVLPQELRLADGRSGRVGAPLEGSFTAGSAHDTPCTLAGLETVQQLDQAINNLLSIGPAQQSRFHAWVGTLDQSAARRQGSQPVFVLIKDTTFTNPKPSMMDPDTQTPAALERLIERSVYDLQTGAALSQEQQAFLSGSKTLGQPLDGSARAADGSPYSTFTFSPDPPADLAGVFSEAVQRLEQFLKQ